MKVYAVEICKCDEYGCMGLWRVFETEAAAHAAAKAHGYQCDDEGDAWNFRGDYYQVREMEVLK